MKGRVFAVVFGFFLMSCSYTFRQYVPSMTPVNPYKKYKILPKVEGKACTFKLFYLIPFSEVRFEDALRDAVPVGSKVDTMIGVTVETENDFYGIGSYYCIHVSGYPVVFKPSHYKNGIFSQKLNPVINEEEEESFEIEQTKAVKEETHKKRHVKKHHKKSVKKEVPKEEEEIVIKCDDLCAKYASILKDKSPLIQNYVKKSCLQKCNGQNINFIECALEAKTFKDVEKCNKL